MKAGGNKMKMTIVIPFRPSRGGMSGPGYKMIQNEDGEWGQEIGKITGCIRSIKDDLERCVLAINKNSHWKHDILVATDEDVIFNEKWLNKMPDNLKIFNAKNGGIESPQTRQVISLRDAVLSLRENEMVCYAIIADVVVSKNWDIAIDDAYKQHGDNHVYASMFVEPRTKISKSHLNAMATDPINGQRIADETRASGPVNFANIWVNWRKVICCHSLTMLIPLDRDHMIEKDLDDYIKVATSQDKCLEIEPCGARIYGYWAPLIAKASKFQKIMSSSDMPLGHGADLWIDNNMPVENKVVVTKSFVFHLHVPCIIDDVEVEHE